MGNICGGNQDKDSNIKSSTDKQIRASKNKYGPKVIPSNSSSSENRKNP